MDSGSGLVVFLSGGAVVPLTSAVFFKLDRVVSDCQCVCPAVALGID